MNKRILLLLTAALVVAGITAFMARAYLTRSRPEPQEMAAQKIEVLVASSPLGMGHLIASGDLRWQEWPAQGIDPNYIQKASGESLEGQIGKVVRYGLTPGEPLTLARVIAPGEHGFLAAILKPGMRAFTVSISRTSGLAGFVFPGDRVDVIFNHEVKDGSGILRTVSETILQNIRVIGVDTRTSDIEQKPELGKSVTLEVTPKIAEKLALVSKFGTMTLALRSLTPAEASGKQAISPDNLEPVEGPASFTVDSEVSQLLPPWNPNSNIVTVVRGSSSQTIGYGSSQSGGDAGDSFSPITPTDDDQ